MTAHDAIPESTAAPEGAAEEGAGFVYTRLRRRRITPNPNNALPRRARLAGRLRSSSRSSRGHVENNVYSVDSVVNSTRSTREYGIGPVKVRVREVSIPVEKTSRSVGDSFNHLAICSLEVAEIDNKRARTRTIGRSEEGKRDRVQRRCHLCKGISAGKTGTSGAGDGRPNAEAEIGRIGMGRGPAQGADQRIARFLRGEVVRAPDDRCVGNRSKCEGQSRREV